jgi:hypothetical protein
MATPRRWFRRPGFLLVAALLAAPAAGSAAETETLLLATFETSTGLGFEGSVEPGLASLFKVQGDDWGSVVEFGFTSREKIDVGGSARWGRLYLTREFGEVRLMGGVWGNQQETDLWSKSTFGPTVGLGYRSVELRFYVAEEPDQVRVGCLRWRLPFKRLPMFVEAGFESFVQPSGASGSGAIFGIMIGPRLRFR